jgi:hypothetical protein
MKKTLLILFLTIFIGQGCSQTNPPKIKVYLLGTFHFAQTDSTYNVLDDKHQNSISDLNKIIIGIKPDKIFIERMPDFEYVNKVDSLYMAYLNRTEETNNPNEIWQVAFKVGEKLRHKKLYQCDSPGRFGGIYAQLKEYSKEHNQDNILSYEAKGTTKPLTSKIDVDSLRNSVSLLEYIKWLNSKKVQFSSLAHYVNVYPQIGNTDVYHYDKDYFIGTELTADWYRRNIYTYSKMLNQIDYTEKSIFLLMGNDHIPIIRQLFQSNPYFEVMDVEKWLGKTKIK